MTENLSTTTAEPDDDLLEQEYTPGEGDTGMFGEGAAVRKPKRFWPSARRLFGLMAPEKWGFALVVALVIASVILTVWAPRVLGDAMDVIFDGAVGHQLGESFRCHPGRGHCRTAREWPGRTRGRP